jgi:hypothetical protein
MDLENQKRLRDALHRRGSSKEDPKPLNEAAQRTSSMLEKWNLVWKDISDVVAEVAPQLAGKEGVTPDDQCEKVDLSMLPPEACTPPLFVEARIALTNWSERKKRMSDRSLHAFRGANQWRGSRAFLHFGRRAQIPRTL